MRRLPPTILMLLGLLAGCGEGPDGPEIPSVGPPLPPSLEAHWQGVDADGDAVVLTLSTSGIAIQLGDLPADAELAAASFPWTLDDDQLVFTRSDETIRISWSLIDPDTLHLSGLPTAPDTPLSLVRTRPDVLGAWRGAPDTPDLYLEFQDGTGCALRHGQQELTRLGWYASTTVLRQDRDGSASLSAFARLDSVLVLVPWNPGTAPLSLYRTFTGDAVPQSSLVGTWESVDGIAWTDTPPPTLDLDLDLYADGTALTARQGTPGSGPWNLEGADLTLPDGTAASRWRLLRLPEGLLLRSRSPESDAAATVLLRPRPREIPTARRLLMVEGWTGGRPYPAGAPGDLLILRTDSFAAYYEGPDESLLLGIAHFQVQTDGLALHGLGDFPDGRLRLLPHGDGLLAQWDVAGRTHLGRLRSAPQVGTWECVQLAIEGETQPPPPWRLTVDQDLGGLFRRNADSPSIPFAWQTGGDIVEVLTADAELRGHWGFPWNDGALHLSGEIAGRAYSTVWTRSNQETLAVTP